jgi:hypothetical protein
MTTWDEQPRLGETHKEWLARLIREGCPPDVWCRLADASPAPSAPQHAPVDDGQAAAPASKKRSSMPEGQERDA